MSTSEYAFTDRAHEQRRLASQAELFNPLTERVFRRPRGRPPRRQNPPIP